MAALAETILNNKLIKVYFSADDTATITGDVATVPVGFTELGQNSKYSVRGSSETFEAQRRETQGHKDTVDAASDDHEITFDFIQKKTNDPGTTHGFRIGFVCSLLKVKSNGYYEFFPLVLVTSVEEGGDTGGQPTWNGTAKAKRNPVYGKITTWPPD